MQLEQRLSARENSFYKVVVVTVFAMFTGLAAQVRIPVPFSPVPVTGQTFIVLLSPLLIDRWSVLSQILYTSLGILGVPWFSGHSAGLQTLLGPTGGYLLGFIVASFFISQGPQSSKHRSSVAVVLRLAIANFGLIYGFGLIQLYLWFAGKGVYISLSKLLSMGLIPFVSGDLIKILLAYSTYSLFRKISE